MSQHLETLALHAGQKPDPTTGSRAVPIYQTTSYVFEDAEHAANLFALKAFGNIYTRLMNPTTDVLEQRLAALHGGTGAVATSSGQAAIFYAIAAITSAGQNIISTTNLYGGTINLFRHTLKRFGIEVRFVDSSDASSVAAAIDENTRLVYTESIGNPKGNVDDFEAIAAIAHDSGIPFIVDNTVSPPPLFNPLEHGADVVVLSLTKLAGGHGTSLGGIVIEKGDFPWNNGKFPEIAGPDPSYHGVNFWDAFGNHPEAVAPGLAYVLKIRTGLLRDIGATLSPFNAQQVLLGVETLPLRAERHVRNAQAVAEWLERHPLVTWVNYPGLPSHPDYDRAQRYLPNGAGAILGFGVQGGLEAGKRFISAVKLASNLANVLDAKTLVIHPASTTHQQLSPEEQAAAGVSPDFVRLSVGLEHLDDILADLDQALQASQVA
ncbi:O-acetylhomoserine aminocarboxypropyltransferase/cysteine synthase family protein [Synechococcus elongatus]|uniref:O-acetylhomoserine/O-acetylserine sulfhydrylase n=2 Tax=Synechococcus elongatus TaxID=32046 RepID=Q31RB7_SYNE7|nr:aminotransferase class V-fold PLP-dependent enzyme [Synechococcus elongatus]ABB56402.1 O-acetylhomoserine/O-acetylserine sulfhydrylase [Synechococcus elongatus PCC 7942 = FACHB-805]AJD56549.1 O-acetylhomoserine aminocarboxypropyltransferase [Synechococcus elongatus UTEX 2973]MBD2588238.1 aminotransferase class V-fold PLP-dependent enzyme [Synechococcus elongatus FACHB-242]MBD2689306.1 aminotransferase class V-fold PLP-dependent enzyme [Synechococcus elongatus FACHB-1061]MBD2707054.1 aminotr